MAAEAAARASELMTLMSSFICNLSDRCSLVEAAFKEPISGMRQASTVRIQLAVALIAWQ